MKGKRASGNGLVPAVWYWQRDPGDWKGRVPDSGTAIHHAPSWAARSFSVAGSGATFEWESSPSSICGDNSLFQVIPYVIS